jgi:hypothetical protein
MSTEPDAVQSVSKSVLYGMMANDDEWPRMQELAEGVRFELTREQSPLPVFKTGALNHSATLPCQLKEALIDTTMNIPATSTGPNPTWTQQRSAATVKAHDSGGLSHVGHFLGSGSRQPGNRNGLRTDHSRYRKLSQRN